MQTTGNIVVDLIAALDAAGYDGTKVVRGAEDIPRAIDEDDEVYHLTHADAEDMARFSVLLRDHIRARTPPTDEAYALYQRLCVSTGPEARRRDALNKMWAMFPKSGMTHE